MLSSAVAVRPEEIKKRINSEKKLLTTTIYTYEFDQVIDTSAYMTWPF